jgi:pectinesterase
MRNLTIALLTVMTAQASAQERLTVRVQNPIAIAREDETVALPWATVVRELPGVTAARVRVIDGNTNREVTAQALDGNADGQIDSLLFQVRLWPNDVRSYHIEAAAPVDSIMPRVHAKFVADREDVAWESDRIAFRIYGKKLWELENLHTNGIDVWPKRTRALVLDPWYAKGHDGYHIDVGEGADFYSVGTTLGAGGTGIWKDNKLFRGDNFLQHRIVADGPIRAIFELDYGAIDAAGMKATETKRVSIDAGSQFFRQESKYRADNATDLEIVVGLVKRAGMVGSSSKARGWAWVTAWAPVQPNTDGHGDLGLAVLVDKAHLMDTREIDDHYVAIGKARSGQPLVSYVGAGWTSSRDFSSAEDWWKHVDQFAQRLSRPVTVTLSRNNQTVK